MVLKFGLSAAICQDLRLIFAASASIQKVLIFGSRAKGNYQEGSDIDLAVIAPEMSDREFSEIWNAIDRLPLVFKIDLLHWDRLQNESLKQKILAEGQVFYS